MRNPAKDLPLKSKKCRCGAKAFRRINRITFMERVVLPWLGFYPWECAVCRRKTFLRNDGRGELGKKAGELGVEAVSSW